MMLDQNLIGKIKSYSWTKRWAGSYAFVSCSNYGWQYYNSMRAQFGAGLELSLQIHRAGTVSCFLPVSELKRIAQKVEQQILSNPDLPTIWLENVIAITDKILPLMLEMKNTIPSPQNYERFANLYDEFLPNHVFMKEMIDFLPKKLTVGIFDKFAKARAYSEPVYSESERFFRSIARAIGAKEKIDENLLTCLNRSEFNNYLKNGLLPETEKLRSRFALSVIFYNQGDEMIPTGDNAKEIENIVASVKNIETREIRGRAGFGGTAKGICRIIADPFKYERFDEGNILVTGMTRPEFIPLMKKASAFVTDAGGMLCHAAITAREMKKPCVIGTEVATRILKDGDIIEVDADNGIIRRVG
jgi:phosphohistidine swiveling domain-containing protein